MLPTLVVGEETITGPVVVDLDSLKYRGKKIPVLDDHDESKEGRIGATTSIRIENYTINVKGVIYTGVDRSKHILSANDGGHQWQLSVGLDSFRLERVPAGRSILVNGQTFDGPLTVLRNARLTDLSFVSVGGDDTTWARIAARRVRSSIRLSAGKFSEGSAVEFKEWMAANYPDLDVSTVGQVAIGDYKRMFNATKPGDQNVGDLTPEEAARSLRVALARKKKSARAGRAKALGGDGASVGLSVEQVTNRILRAQDAETARQSHIDAMANGNDELAAKAKREKWSTDKFDLAILQGSRTRPSSASSRSNDEESMVMEAALLINSGSIKEDRLKHYFDESILNKAIAGRYRGFSIVECADRLINRAGIGYEGSRNQTGHMEACRDANAKLRAGGYTSLTLSSILENASDKVLLEAYAAVATIWRFFCAVRSLNDFKVHSQYALDPLSVFREVGPQGDFANMDFSDRKYSLQAGSYGIRTKIDYQIWRNDDLSAITNRMASVGSLGASTIEQVVNALLMLGVNNSALFHASNNNYDASASAVFGIAGLKRAETMWANQVRPNLTPLGITPQQLIVGTALKSDADTIFTSKKLNEVFTTAQTRTGPAGSENKFCGKYNPTENAYLNNALLKHCTGKDGKAVAIANQSDRLWMLLARRGNSAPMHVGFLDGRQKPKVEIINNQSEMIGFELAAGMHFGVGYGDPLLASCFDPPAP